MRWHLPLFRRLGRKRSTVHPGPSTWVQQGAPTLQWFPWSWVQTGMTLLNRPWTPTSQRHYAGKSQVENLGFEFVASVLFFSKLSVERIKSGLFVSGQDSSTHSLSSPSPPPTAPLSPTRDPGHQHISWDVTLVWQINNIMLFGPKELWQVPETEAWKSSPQWSDGDSHRSHITLETASKWWLSWPR